MTLLLDDYTPQPNTARASTLPARWYVEPQFLEKEKENIFYRTWQCVARAEQVARRGDYLACAVLDEPLVLSRGTDEVLRAFSNVCKHRAGAVAVGKGNRKSLQCMYHGWTYGLDGKLLTAPEMEGVEWDRAAFCLDAVRVETWGGFVFVNLDPHAPPLHDVLGDIPHQVERAGFRPAEMEFVERRDYYVDCNWKVYIDNYLEGYHVPIAHPGLFREIDYENYKVDTYRYYSSQYAPIRELKPGEVHGRDRRFLRTEGEEQALYYWIFPNFMLNLYPDNLQINIILPLGHEKTLTIFEWYFLQPGSGAGWNSLQESIKFSDEVQREDIAICEIVQKGLRSRTYDTGRFSAKRENGVHHFHLLLNEFLRQ